MKLVGLNDQLQTITNIVKISKKIHNLRIKIPKSLKLSILLSGEPGTGKTASVKQVAEENGIDIILVKFSDIVSGVLGDSLHRLDDVFKKAKERAQKAPIILFFDEIDAIGKERSDKDDVGEIKRLVITFLQNIDEMDYEKTPVIIVGATNHPQVIDSALFRRFMVKLEYGRPSRDVIKQFFKSFAESYAGENLVIDFTANLDGVVEKFEDSTISEIENVLNTKIIEKLATDETISTLSCGDFIEVEENFEAQIKKKQLESIKSRNDESEKRNSLIKEINNIDNEIETIKKSKEDTRSIQLSIDFNRQRIAEIESGIKSMMKVLNAKKESVDKMKDQNKTLKSKLIQDKIDILSKDYNEKYQSVEPNLKEIDRRKKEIIDFENKIKNESIKDSKVNELLSKKKVTQEKIDHF